MQVLIGRLTADAKVATLKDERQVVNFSIAMNHSYTPKGGERRKQTTFVECAYWVSTGIAKYLKKGLLVELYGNLTVDAYTSLQGTVKGVLRFHVNSIQLHGNVGLENKTPAHETTAADVTEPVDDLPF